MFWWWTKTQQQSTFRPTVVRFRKCMHAVAANCPIKTGLRSTQTRGDAVTKSKSLSQFTRPCLAHPAAGTNYSFIKLSTSLIHSRLATLQHFRKLRVPWPTFWIRLGKGLSVCADRSKLRPKITQGPKAYLSSGYFQSRTANCKSVLLTAPFCGRKKRFSLVGSVVSERQGGSF